MKIIALTHDDAAGVYAQDVPAFAEVIKSSAAEVILAPGTSRFRRSLAAAALRAGAAVDTNIVDVTLNADGTLTAQRWFYRQRIIANFTRTARPWVLVVDPSLFNDLVSKLGAEMVNIPAVSGETRTTQTGTVSATAGGESTLRPDSPLLFVAGAGWMKKQADGAPHLDEAAGLITGFLGKSGASLGTSKSLVDMPEVAAAFPFMSHMNQVGQTGSTPRHVKGLATCCHGEEPHAVGWRFVNERRAINLDANCGWAQGKTDVLYVADAFAVMQKLNELI